VQNLHVAIKKPGYTLYKNMLPDIIFKRNILF